MSSRERAVRRGEDRGKDEQQRLWRCNRTMEENRPENSVVREHGEFGLLRDCTCMPLPTHPSPPTFTITRPTDRDAPSLSLSSLAQTIIQYIALRLYLLHTLTPLHTHANKRFVERALEGHIVEEVAVLFSSPRSLGPLHARQPPRRRWRPLDTYAPPLTRRRGP